MKASRAGACSMENQTVARSGFSPVALDLEKPLLAGYRVTEHSGNLTSVLEWRPF